MIVSRGLKPLCYQPLQGMSQSLVAQSLLSLVLMSKGTQGSLHSTWSCVLSRDPEPALVVLGTTTCTRGDPPSMASATLALEERWLSSLLSGTMVMLGRPRCRGMLQVGMGARLLPSRPEVYWLLDQLLV